MLILFWIGKHVWTLVATFQHFGSNISLCLVSTILTLLASSSFVHSSLSLSVSLHPFFPSNSSFLLPHLPRNWGWVYSNNRKHQACLAIVLLHKLWARSPKRNELHKSAIIWLPTTTVVVCAFLSWTGAKINLEFPYFHKNWARSPTMLHRSQLCCTVANYVAP